MSSKSSLSYASRAEKHSNPLVKRLFELAEQKKSNLVISADLTTTDELLDCADKLGPYIAVFKTHIDVVSDFSDKTVQGLKDLADKHNFMIFEDRKLVDIGNTVQKQYHGGSLRISEWAHLVNLSVLGGEGIVEALSQTISEPSFPYAKGERGFLILAEMTSKGSVAKGDYTTKCIDAARMFPDAMVGFVATRALTELQTQSEPAADEDFVVFTTGVNISSKGDKLGQQYQTPKEAVEGGADFIIAGRGIYAAGDPIDAAKQYQNEGWDTYVARTSSLSS